MTSLDRRTKRRADVRPVTIDGFVAEVAPRHVVRNGSLAAAAQQRLGLPPLTLEVGGARCTIDGGTVRAGPGTRAIVAVLEPSAMSDLVAGVRSTSGLTFAGGAEVGAGDFGAFILWDHVLRALLDGVELPARDATTFEAADGTALDLRRSFAPDDEDEEIAHFLAEAGFLHLRGWIDPTVLGSVEREVAAAATDARPDEPHRWWSRMADGSDRCTRVMYLLQVSPTMADLVEQDAYQRLGALFPDGHRRFPERPQSSEALIKPLGVAAGITEFPFHRDCSFGGHDYDCAGYAVGLPLSGTGEEEGHLQVVAGSHRVPVPAPGSVPGYDPGLPVVSVMTQPGDLTVHVGCTLHGTVAPRTRGRTVAYTTFCLPPHPGEDRPALGAMPDLDRVTAANRP